MKKILFLIAIISFYFMMGKVVSDTQMIPKEAIRIRVIGNSNEERDQQLKLSIKDELEQYYYHQLKDVKGVSNASAVIERSLPTVEKLIANQLGNQDFSIHYGMNYFPQKEYKGITYDEGYYQSLVVTLGSGNGKNWWCVLFPPLCLLENNQMEEVEYRSLVADMIEKYF